MNVRLDSYALVALLASGLSACAATSDDSPTVEIAAPVVYGGDDRLEYFQVPWSDARATMAGSTVALFAKTALEHTAEGMRVAASVPSWGQAAGLCPGEPFADQPAAAFCSGVLVDWDLVLTAGHCARLLALSDISIAFGYTYSAPGVLAIGDDVRQPIAIVAEALDPEGIEPRLDYAWLRLDRLVAPPRRPVPIRAAATALAPGAPLVAIGAGGGVPIKLDAGGNVHDARAGAIDYFTANTDTSHGSSGSGAFDPQLALVGVLARGQPDLIATPAGCAAIAHLSDEAAGEEFTYAWRALAALCAADASASALCRPNCGDPCASPAAPAGSGGDGDDDGRGGGCALAPPPRHPGWPPLVGWLGVVGASAWSRRRRPSPARLPTPSPGGAGTRWTDPHLTRPHARPRRGLPAG